MMWESFHTFAKLGIIRNPCTRSKVLPLKYLYRGKQSYSKPFRKSEEVSNVDNIQDKIIYNCITTPKHYLDVFKKKKNEFNDSLKTHARNNPIALNFINNDQYKAEDDKCTQSTQCKDDPKPVLPFKRSIDYGLSEEPYKNEGVINGRLNIDSMYMDYSIKGAKSWMNDYEKYCDVDSEADTERNDWLVNYGTPDPDVPISNVGCGGCGAYLHCQEPSIPGYLPSEIFSECNKHDLESILCQRCHFLNNYNTALSVHVNPNNYVELISRIKPEALIILLIDLTDISGSVWPQISDVVGRDRPIFLVGNKIDLLWGDRPKWLEHVNSVLRDCVPSKMNIIGSSLVSAKTGFGVEELVSNLHTTWRYKNDVYLVGCTNVGKSTLFNALIQSDYCKTKAVDLVQRATTAPWPGTTLNLLKFPILRPSAWRLAVRNVRLNQERSRKKAENELQKLQKKVTRKRPSTPPQLIGNIAHSFKTVPEGEDKPDLFNLPSTNIKNYDADDRKISLVNSHFPDFDQGRWFYDTPGVLHKDQILNLLTAEELLLTLPKELIFPRTFLMYKAMTLLIAGLARIDYTHGEKGVKFTVFCSNHLPITICQTENADEVYNHLLGSEMMLVPQGPASRMHEWPGLAPSQPITLCGVDSEQSCADITYPTIGWIAVSPGKNEICKFTAWSPMGRGISIRHPSILPFAVKLRGKKIPKSPAYLKSKPYQSSNY